MYVVVVVVVCECCDAYVGVTRNWTSFHYMVVGTGTDCIVKRCCCGVE